MINLSWRSEPVLKALSRGVSPSPEIIIGFDTIAIALYHRLQKSLSDTQTKTQKDPATTTLLGSSAAILLGSNFLALKAPVALLPWVNGLHYLSTSNPDFKLYIPSNLHPNVPIPWIEGALRESLGESSKKALKEPSQAKEKSAVQRHDLLYWPTTNTLIQADNYWPIAIVKQNHLLTHWYEQQYS